MGIGACQVAGQSAMRSRAVLEQERHMADDRSPLVDGNQRAERMVFQERRQSMGIPFDEVFWNVQGILHQCLSSSAVIFRPIRREIIIAKWTKRFTTHRRPARKPPRPAAN